MPTPKPIGWAMCHMEAQMSKMGRKKGQKRWRDMSLLHVWLWVEFLLTLNNGNSSFIIPSSSEPVTLLTIFKRVKGQGFWS